MSKDLTRNDIKNVGIGLLVWFLFVSSICLFFQVDETRVWVASIEDETQDVIFDQRFLLNSNINDEIDNFKYNRFANNVSLSFDRWKDYTVLYEITPDENGKYVLQKDKSGKIINGKKIHSWTRILSSSEKENEKKYLAEAGEIEEPVYIKKKDELIEVRRLYTDEIEYTKQNTNEKEFEIAAAILKVNERIRGRYVFESDSAHTEIRDNDDQLVYSAKSYLSDSKIEEKMKDLKSSQIILADHDYKLYQKPIPVPFNFSGWIAGLFLFPLGLLIVLIKISGYAFKESKEGEKDYSSQGVWGKLNNFNKVTPFMFLCLIWLAIVAYWQLPNILNYLGVGIGSALQMILPYILWIFGIIGVVAIVVVIRNAYAEKLYDNRCKEREEKALWLRLEKGKSMEEINQLLPPPEKPSFGFGRSNPNPVAALEHKPNINEEDVTDAEYDEIGAVEEDK